MSDDNDKIRRNLVVVSGVILAGAFLELPASDLIDLFAKTNTLSDVPQSKFWALGFVLLAYLLARYRFSSDGQNMVAMVLNTRRLEWSRLRQEEIHRAVSVFNGTGKLTSSICGASSVVEREVNAGQRFGPVNFKPRIVLNSSYQHDSSYKQVAFYVECGESEPDTGFSPKPRDEFTSTFPLFQRYYFESRARFIAYFYSESAIQQVAPVLFAALALFTLCVRVISRVSEYW